MTNNIFSFSATETGYNHIKVEPSKACEDASGFYDDDQMHICVVADGHGSDNYPRTDRGSQFAVDAAIEQIKAFVGKIYDPDSEDIETSKKESNELIDKLLHTKINETHLLQYLSRNILMKWREFVEKDVKENPFQESEMTNVSEKYRKRYMPEDISERRAEKAYGCTLIAYVVTEKFSFGMQIGDGKCVVIDKNGSISEPIPWDENCQMNVTTSICDSDAADEFRFFVTEEKPAAVFCGSDGIDDSYANVEEMYALYRSVLKIFVEHGIDVGKSEIQEYLPVLTKRGSGDDVSIA
ncbi:MAG: protein phosphatase 2C domain-containing protein, partial [Blautia sp.]|nr:protein phosphatase 2C domain-containing protein [Blautia sp.]